MSSLKNLDKSNHRRSLIFERLMALLALANLVLVLFDLSYVPWRNFYFRQLPGLAKKYDQVKGIEPHRETQKYLDAVEQLKNQVAATGLRSPESEALLKELQRLSADMIDTNPFAQAGKTGTLERIKNRMREHIPNPTNSSKQAFRTFWSSDYLLRNGWQQEITFYDRQVQPLIAINYFRRMGENDDFENNFWLYDSLFNLIFALEFLTRTYFIHRRHQGLRWVEALLWRWYDIFLIIPFSLIGLPLLSLLRFIPVTLRLYQAELLDLDLIRAQLNQGFVANFAEELTEVVVLRIITQMQTSIRQGEIIKLLSGKESRPYIDLNNVNEVEAIAKLAINVTVYDILPKIQTDIEAILKHNIEKILSQLPAYQSLQHIPGLNAFPAQVTERLSTQIYQSIYSALTGALAAEDPVGDELNERLVKHLGEAIGSEAQKQQTIQKIQSLLSDLLEEVKINYVKRLSKQDLDEILEQTRQIRQLPQR